MDYQVGDIVQLKKKHPCGSSEWEILRVGADFKLKCCGCGHEIMVRRSLVENNTKNLKKAGNHLRYMIKSYLVIYIPCSSLIEGPTRPEGGAT